MKDNQEFRFKVDRRGFLSRSACASLGIGSMVNTLAHLSLIDRVVANDVNIGSDYKALICIFLRGGQDSNYFFRPIGGHPQKAQYEASRGIAAPPEAAISAAGTVLNPANGPAGQFGLQPNCVNMATMFNNGELAIIQNVGTLAEPTTKTQYQQGTVLLPVQLFSHSNQVQEWMATAAEKPFTSGWGGAVSSLINDAANPNGLASMLITAAGNNNFLVSPGGGPAQYSVNSSGALSLVGYSSGSDPYGGAIDSGTGHYTTSATGRRLQAFERIMNYTHDHILAEGYNEVARRARAGEGLIGDALAEAAALQGTGAGQVNFNGNFPANNNLADELKLVSQLIAGRRCLGNTRQIFFCDLGGFDNHASININLPNLLSQVDGAVGGFNTTMKQLALADAEFSYDDFTCFEMSDFNRTFTPNGTSANSNGTDHAWASHAWCFGGAVKAQHAGASNLYGHYPDLNPAGPDSVSGRGRYIPTTSVDQYGAVLAEWFGVAPGDLSMVFPNLPRFTHPSDPAANLGFIDLTS